MGIVNTLDSDYIEDMSKPGPQQRYPYKRLLFMTSALCDAVRVYRFERGLETEAEALRELIEVGLSSSRKERPFRQTAIPVRPSK